MSSLITVFICTSTYLAFLVAGIEYKLKPVSKSENIPNLIETDNWHEQNEQQHLILEPDLTLTLAACESGSSAVNASHATGVAYTVPSDSFESLGRSLRNSSVDEFSLLNDRRDDLNIEASCAWAEPSWKNSKSNGLNFEKPNSSLVFSWDIQEKTAEERVSIRLGKQPWRPDDDDDESYPHGEQNPSIENSWIEYEREVETHRAVLNSSLALLGVTDAIGEHYQGEKPILESFEQLPSINERWLAYTGLYAWRDPETNPKKRAREAYDFEPSEEESVYTRVPLLSSFAAGALVLASDLDDRRKRRKNQAGSSEPNEGPTSSPGSSYNPNDTYIPPGTGIISQEQLIAEIKGIYAGLVMVEAKCMEIDMKKSTPATAALPTDQDLQSNRYFNFPKEGIHTTLTDRMTTAQSITSTSFKAPSPEELIWTPEPPPEDTEDWLSRLMALEIPREETRTPEVLPSTTSLKSWTCSHCERSFHRKSMLKKHLNYHTKPVHCFVPGCEFACARAQDLRRHLQTKKHRDLFSNELHYCFHLDCVQREVYFTRRDNLLRHWKNVHGCEGRLGDEEQ